jgi:ribosomal protein S18 acetylase RimI-like enzyme
MVTSTSDLDSAGQWANELLGEGNPVPFFLSPHRFEKCERTSDSLSFTLSGEQCYGLGFGPQPRVNPDWTKCSIDNSHFGDELGRLIAGDRWDFYSLDTTLCEVEGSLFEVRDDELVSAMLVSHAPQSQVWPGNAELVGWFGLNDSQGELASLAALVRWESGLHVLSSVVTVTEKRARGHARTLVRGIAGELHYRGFRWLGLGVAHNNAAAHRAYEQAGFLRRAQFLMYSLPSTI